MNQDAIHSLVAEILNIPGIKIITLAIDDECFKIDIDERGNFGYHPGHQALFRTKLVRALQQGGGMIIREFLPLRVKTKMPNGKEAWISEKNLYGVFLRDGIWIGQNAEEVQMAHETDAITGKSIPREQGVHYRDFPLLNKKEIS